MRIPRIPFIMAFVLLTISTAQAMVTIETVPVGNPGNPGDMRYPTSTISSFGSVGYEYSIGKYEVTAGQYTEFLNGVAATDPYDLYNPRMWSNENSACRIQRFGSPGNYTYKVEDTRANRPVTHVSWDDAVRFANWMHNGQGDSDTETGSYNLNGSIAPPNQPEVTREPGATWVIPSKDEWYKSAYHKNDGVTSNYFDYPTSSDSISITMANCEMSIGHPIDVGSYAFPSPYGTYDQSGNVSEWTEALRNNSARRLFGTSFFHHRYDSHASVGFTGYPVYEDPLVGFRLAYIPEPISLTLLAIGSLGVLHRRKK